MSQKEHTNWLPEGDQLKNANGQPFLKRLFLEQSYTVNDKERIPYTLRDEDHPDGYKSLYALYILEEDLSEYTFAKKYLLSYDHWKLLCETSWFKPYAERWKRDLHAKVNATLQKDLLAISRDSSHKNQFEALKMLLQTVAPTSKSRYTAEKGRPSAELVKARIDEIAKEEVSLKDDATRIFSIGDQ